MSVCVCVCLWCQSVDEAINERVHAKRMERVRFFVCECVVLYASAILSEMFTRAHIKHKSVWVSVMLCVCVNTGSCVCASAYRGYCADTRINIIISPPRRRLRRRSRISLHAIPHWHTIESGMLCECECECTCVCCCCCPFVHACVLEVVVVSHRCAPLVLWSQARSRVFIKRSCFVVSAYCLSPERQRWWNALRIFRHACYYDSGTCSGWQESWDEYNFCQKIKFYIF